MRADNALTQVMAFFGAMQTLVIAWLAYLQWRGTQRTKLIEAEEQDDQHLMTVFQSQLKSALARIDHQDQVIQNLRDEIHDLKIALTEQVIENKKLRAGLGTELT